MPLSSASTERFTLVIADDHPLVLSSLRLLFECVGWVGRIELCRDGLELWDKTLAVAADAVITDLSMPRIDGLSSIRRLRQRFPRLAIVAISGAEHWYPESEVFEAGADAYLSKHRPGEDVVAALAAALERHDRTPQNTPAPRRSNVARQPAADELSGREREILKLLAEGYGNDETADLLSISPATVRKHREHLHNKLGTSNTATLTRIAVRMGLVAN